MPQEPRNDDQLSDPNQQWSGEIEPSTGPVEASVERDEFAHEEAPSPEPFHAYIDPDVGPTQPNNEQHLVVQNPVSDWGQVESALPPETEPVVAAESLLPVTPLATVVPESTVVATAPKKNKKPLIIGIVLAVIFVVFGGGSVLAYNLWYQNPEKVISDAIINAATAKSSVYVGTLTNEAESVKTVIDITAKQSGTATGLDAKLTIDLAGKDYTVNGSAVIDPAGDLYFKVDKLKSLVDEYKSLFGTMVDAVSFETVDKLVAKIDGTWIKVSSDDLKAYDDSTAKAKTCVNDAVAKFKDDRTAVGEITNLYKKSSFVSIDKKIGVKDGSLGYVIKGDSAAAKTFAEGLKDTKIYKTLHDCDDAFTIDMSAVDAATATANNDGTVELWVDRWSHQMTKLTFSGTSEGSKTTGTVTPTYNQPVEIKTPSASMTLKQLQTEIETLLQDFAPTSSASMASTDVSSVEMYAEMYASNNRGSYPTLVQLMPSLPVGIQSKVSAVTPDASTVDSIGYVMCGTRGADITYYDTVTKTVQHAKIGNCV